jgi:hypothetical protein
MDLSQVTLYNKSVTDFEAVFCTFPRHQLLQFHTFMNSASPREQSLLLIESVSNLPKDVSSLIMYRPVFVNVLVISSIGLTDS